MAEDLDSSDEALCELLGIESLQLTACEEESVGFSQKDGGDHIRFLQHYLQEIDSGLQQELASDLGNLYKNEGVCVFPDRFRVSDAFMRRITDELVWSGGDKVFPSDKTFETVQSLQRGTTLVEKRVLTRLENFVNHHPEWKSLCDYVGDILSRYLFNEPMVLFKEKLNLKPPGGSGFAPHLDAPSLRVALGNKGPKTFVTVMVAIDPMTSRNGCLRVVKGSWTEQNCIPTVEPEVNGNPDAGGRAGAISEAGQDLLRFEDLECDTGGVIAAFGGWTPHRSSSNTSPFPRRAVFLTYNPLREGNFHDAYYEHMEALRREWRASVGLANAVENAALSEDEQAERDALATIPRI